MTISCPHCGAAYECGAEYYGRTFHCSSCGAECFVPAPSVPPPPVQYPQVPVYYVSAPQPPAYYAQAPVVYSGPRAKQRWVYIVLALFLGGLGVHDFYAGEVGHGAAKLLITTAVVFFSAAAALFSAGVLLAGALIGWATCGIWTLLDILVVKEDAEGVPFE